MKHLQSITCVGLAVGRSHEGLDCEALQARKPSPFAKLDQRQRPSHVLVNSCVETMGMPSSSFSPLSTASSAYTACLSTPCVAPHVSKPFCGPQRGTDLGWLTTRPPKHLVLTGSWQRACGSLPVNQIPRLGFRRVSSAHLQPGCGSPFGQRSRPGHTLPRSQPRARHRVLPLALANARFGSAGQA